jgi:hypothetical protein
MKMREEAEDRLGSDGSRNGFFFLTRRACDLYSSSQDPVTIGSLAGLLPLASPRFTTVLSFPKGAQWVRGSVFRFPTVAPEHATAAPRVCVLRHVSQDGRDRGPSASHKLILVHQLTIEMGVFHKPEAMSSNLRGSVSSSHQEAIDDRTTTPRILQTLSP